MDKGVDNFDERYARVKHGFQLISLFAAVAVGVGTVFYHIVEKLNWLDAIYFCVVTLATVGYGDFSPKTELGKAFTIFYILIGIGIIATFANLLLKRSAYKHEIRRKNANAKNTTH